MELWQLENWNWETVTRMFLQIRYAHNQPRPKSC